MDVRIDPEKLGQRQSVYKLLAGLAESGGANFGHSSELICLFGGYCNDCTRAWRVLCKNLFFMINYINNFMSKFCQNNLYYLFRGLLGLLTKVHFWQFYIRSYITSWHSNKRNIKDLLYLPNMVLFCDMQYWKIFKKKM